MAQMKAVLKGGSKTITNTHKWAQTKHHAHAWVKKTKQQRCFWWVRGSTTAPNQVFDCWEVFTGPFILHALDFAGAGFFILVS